MKEYEEIINPVIRKLADDFVKGLNKNDLTIDDLEGSEKDRAIKIANMLLGFIPTYITELEKPDEN